MAEESERDIKRRLLEAEQYTKIYEARKRRRSTSSSPLKSQHAQTSVPPKRLKEEEQRASIQESLKRLNEQGVEIDCRLDESNEKNII